jgi:site-specific DNA-methyltransferase (adenine-specific)
MTYELHLGDCLKVLRGVPADSIDSIVTDPPYGLSFMGKKWDYDVPAVEVWAECLRVLKPGGHLLAFAGTRTQHRMAVRIEDAGFEIRDMIAWVYGSGFPKSRNVGKDIEGMAGWGTALKPSLEPITMARKPLIGTVAENVIAHGTGAINIDGCRVASHDSNPSIARRQGSTNHLSTRTAAESVAAGKLESRQSPETYRAERAGEALGRWPANLIHDGSSGVVALFPAEAGVASRVKGTEPTANGFSGAVAYSGMMGRIEGAFHGDSGSAARFFYCAKAKPSDRHEGLEHPGQQFKQGTTLRRVQTTDTKGNNHPTVKPTELMAYLLRLVTPVAGTALDPFMGSGSTGKAAMIEGFNFIGIEQDAAYLAIATARIAHAKAKSQMQQSEQQLQEQQLSLFSA